MFNKLCLGGKYLHPTIFTQVVWYPPPKHNYSEHSPEPSWILCCGVHISTIFLCSVRLGSLMGKSPFTEIRLSVGAYITSLRTLKRTAALAFVMKSKRADMSAIWSDSTSFIRDTSQIGLDHKESSTFVTARYGPRGREAVLDQSPLLNIVQCAHMHFCLCTFVCESVQKGFGVLFIYSSACGRWPAERAEGHGKTSTLPHVSSFLRHPPCVVASTLCVVSGLLKIDPVRTVRRSTKALRTFTNRGGIILKQQHAARKAIRP